MQQGAFGVVNVYPGVALCRTPCAPWRDVSALGVARRAVLSFVGYCGAL